MISSKGHSYVSILIFVFKNKQTNIFIKIEVFVKLRHISNIGSKKSENLGKILPSSEKNYFKYFIVKCHFIDFFLKI